MTTYTKSLVNDFNNNLNPAFLHSEIVNSEIETTLTGITTDGDNVNIIFVNQLSENEITILNTIISNHDPQPMPIMTAMIAMFQPRKAYYNSTICELLGSFAYCGKINRGPILRIVILSHKDSDVTNFTIRLYNETANSEIGSIVCTNSTPNLNIITEFTNMPELPCILQIHGKRTGGSGNNTRYYVETIQVFV